MNRRSAHGKRGSCTNGCWLTRVSDSLTERLIEWLNGWRRNSWFNDWMIELLTDWMQNSWSPSINQLFELSLSPTPCLNSLSAELLLGTSSCLLPLSSVASWLDFLSFGQTSQLRLVCAISLRSFRTLWTLNISTFLWANSSLDRPLDCPSLKQLKSSLSQPLFYELPDSNKSRHRPRTPGGHSVPTYHGSYNRPHSMSWDAAGLGCQSRRSKEVPAPRCGRDGDFLPQ